MGKQWQQPGPRCLLRTACDVLYRDGHGGIVGCVRPVYTFLLNPQPLTMGHISGWKRAEKRVALEFAPFMREAAPAHFCQAGSLTESQPGWAQFTWSLYNTDIVWCPTPLSIENGLPHHGGLQIHPHGNYFGFASWRLTHSRGAKRWSPEATKLCASRGRRWKGVRHVSTKQDSAPPSWFPFENQTKGGHHLTVSRTISA